MLALRTAAASLVTLDEARQAVRDLYGIDAEIAPLPGERDHNFHLRRPDGAEFVLKIIDPTADPAVVDCQARVLRHLADRCPVERQSPLPVPRLLATVAGADVGRLARHNGGQPVLLIEYLPGRLLGSSPPSAALLRDLGRSLAHIDRALQGFYHPALSQSLAWDVRRLKQLAPFVDHIESADTRRRVAAVTADFAERATVLRGLRSQAIHADCNPNNVLVDGPGERVSGVVDFGDMLHGPLLFEVAIAMSELLTEGITTLEALPAVLHGYTAAQPLQSVEIECLHDVISARHAVTMLVHAWRRMHDPAGAAVLAAAAVRADHSLEQLAAFGHAALTAAWHEAAGTIPRGAPLLRRRRHFLGAGAELFYDQPLNLVRGDGVWLFDAHGRRYLDVYNNVPHVGHAHPSVVAAIHRQSAMLNTHTRYLHAAILEYAEQLTTRLPAHLDTCLFVNSGSEANDVAWRLAQCATGKRGAIVMEHAYHGVTDAAAALTPQAGSTLDPRVDVLRAPPPSLEFKSEIGAQDLAAATAASERAIATLAGRDMHAAAFFLDSALTSNGVLDPPPAWTAAVLAPLRAAGALIVGDEVQYGLGRSGSHFWGFERRGISPDIVTLGKPIGNGFPVGAIIANRDLVEKFYRTTGFFSTFGGNPVAAAAGLAVLEVLQREDLMASAQSVGGHLRAGLIALAARRRCLGQVRGAGLLLGLPVVDAASGAPSRVQAKRMVNELASKHGVLTGTEGPQGAVVKLRPPMAFRREHADLVVAAIDAVAVELDALKP